MSGIEVAASLTLGDVSEQIDGMGNRLHGRLDKLGEVKYIPRRRSVNVSFKNTPTFAMVIFDDCPPGRIWNVLALTPVVRLPTGGGNNEFDANGKACCYIGKPDVLPNNLGPNAANPVGGQGQGWIFGSLPNTGEDYVSGPFTLGTSTTFTLTRHAYWVRQNEAPYCILKNTAPLASFDLMLIVDYLDYAEQDILPNVVGGQHGGVRKFRQANVLPEG